ncbi:MAG: carboxypeptidase regulatory-like domain-containing protein [Kiritimatiellae bacterium]|nr:carboxypeptidase regulatory-like domain-containing protein [Kiritimatiellia bacterium]
MGADGTFRGEVRTGGKHQLELRVGLGPHDSDRWKGKLEFEFPAGEDEMQLEFPVEPVPTTQISLKVILREKGTGSPVSDEKVMLESLAEGHGFVYIQTDAAGAGSRHFAAVNGRQYRLRLPTRTSYGPLRSYESPPFDPATLGEQPFVWEVERQTLSLVVEVTGEPFARHRALALWDGQLPEGWFDGAKRESDAEGAVKTTSWRLEGDHWVFESQTATPSGQHQLKQQWIERRRKTVWIEEDSDRNRIARFYDLPSGDYEAEIRDAPHLCVHPADRKILVNSGTSETQRARIRVVKAPQKILCRVGGRVTDVAGKPLTGRAELWMTGTDQSHVWTDEHGNYSFERLPRGKYELRVSREGFVTHWRVLHLDANQDNLEIRLSPYPRAHGIVRDAGLQPLAGVAVCAEALLPPGTSSGATTDEAGRYALMLKGHTGPYFFIARASFAGPAAFVRVDVTGDCEVDLQFPKAAEVRGIVEFDGVPIQPRDRVGIVVADRKRHGALLYAGAQLDKAGVCTLKLAPGEYRVCLMKRGDLFDLGALSVPDGAERLEHRVTVKPADLEAEIDEAAVRADWLQAQGLTNKAGVGR